VSALKKLLMKEPLRSGAFIERQSIFYSKGVGILGIEGERVSYYGIVMLYNFSGISKLKVGAI
jgi:hypothetical protein